jgi:hypothetical protein
LLIFSISRDVSSDRGELYLYEFRPSLPSCHKYAMILLSGRWPLGCAQVHEGGVIRGIASVCTAGVQSGRRNL